MKKIIMILITVAQVFGFVQAKITFTDTTSAIEIRPTGLMNVQSATGVRYINGKIKSSLSGSVTGYKLYFNNGVYTDGVFEINLTATYDPSYSYSILLDGNGSSFNMITPGTMYEKMRVRNSGSTLMGFPKFQAAQAIMLTSTLNIALDGELDTNIDMNGGWIVLGADLSLKDDVLLTDSGTINFQGYNLLTGQKDLTWTDTVLMLGAKNLSLGGKSSVRGQWIFKNDAHIIGNGYTLDLTHGGVIRIKPNTTVQMSNINLKGLGTGTLQFDDPVTSKLQLDDSYIDMDGNYTVTSGVWYATGPVTVFTRDNELTFNTRATLSVDRATVLYDTLGFNDSNNIIFGNRLNNFASLNGGSVQKVRSLKVGDYNIDGNTQLDRNLAVSDLKRLMIFDNVTIDGDGFAYMFARRTGGMIFNVPGNLGVTFTNILLKDFPIESPAITRGSNTQVIFGNKTQVELGDSGLLAGTWMINGVVIINGNGKTLDLGASGQIIVRPGATLFLDNVTLEGLSGSQIICWDNRGTVSFGNVICKMDDDFSFTQGKMYLLDQLDLLGSATFEYASSKECTITHFGKLFIDKETTFKYAPPVGLGTAADARDLIVMEDDKAEIHLNGGSLSSTRTGLRLTKGTVYVDAHSYIENFEASGPADYNDVEAVCFGNGTPADDLTLRLGSAATLDVLSGKLVMDQA